MGGVYIYIYDGDDDDDGSGESVVARKVIFFLSFFVARKTLHFAYDLKTFEL